MKKYFIAELFVFTVVVILLAGCGPSTVQATSVPLEIDNQKITFEFSQNSVNVPVSNVDNQWTVTLKPEPFTLVLNGNKEIVSVMTLRSTDLVLPLLELSKPLVTIPGTGSALTRNSIYMSDQPIEMYDVNLHTLQNLSYFSLPLEQATETADALKNELGEEPVALFSGRSYIFSSSASDQNFLVEKINEEPIQNVMKSGDSIVLVVFVEKQLNTPSFSTFKWIALNVVFE